MSSTRVRIENPTLGGSTFTSKNQAEHFCRRGDAVWTGAATIRFIKDFVSAKAIRFDHERSRKNQPHCYYCRDCGKEVRQGEARCEACRNGRVKPCVLARKNAVGSHTEEQWQALLKICGHQCLCCKSKPRRIDRASILTKDHVIPIIRGGSNSIENLQPLCMTCNARKGTKAIDYRDAVAIEMSRLLGGTP